MIGPLDPLLADGVIDEVVTRLKSGKEADVWLVRHAGQVVAAKVYRARHARSFKNDAAYKEGRQVRNSRTQRAMDRGSRFGRAAAEEAWKTKEADALYRLHAAGLHVPRPVLFYEGVLLMELVVDVQGRPAPRLIDASLGPEQAAHLYAALRSQVVGMLACDLIHGDLSPYNVLLGGNGPVVIDFPQVVGAAHNGQAESFFLRDLRNIHQFFAALDPALRTAQGDGREIWRAYLRRELSADFVPAGQGAESPRLQGGRHQAQPSHDGAGPLRPGPRPPGVRSRGDRTVGSHPRAGTVPPGGTRPHDLSRAQGGRLTQPRWGGERRGRDPWRAGSMPEVIRVERSPHGMPCPGGGGTMGSTPGHGSPGGEGKSGSRTGTHVPEGGRRRRWNRGRR